MRIAHWPTVISMVIGVVIFGIPTSADAARTVLCTSYAQCKAKGFTDGGYGSVRSTSYWNQTPGRNCTNYVAYRLTKNRLVARPPGTDAARTWGRAARAAGIPVRTYLPRRGDVAWWDAYKGYSGAKGHVAIVERVRADGSIVVSEDNMNGTFMWRVVRRGSAWPSGFVRYPTSDGSPSGLLESMRSEDGKVSVSGMASEPDRWGKEVDYTVALGAPLDAANGVRPVETFSFSTVYYKFTWRRTVQTRGPVRAYLYAHNTERTRGKDTLLGVATLDLVEDGSVLGRVLPRTEWLTPPVPAPTPTVPLVETVLQD